MDTPSNPQLKQEFQDLFRFHLRNASELHSVAEFFPCSWESEELMVGHHKSQFKDYLDEGAADIEVEKYRRFGNMRRAEMQTQGERPILITAHKSDGVIRQQVGQRTF